MSRGVNSGVRPMTTRVDAAARSSARFVQNREANLAAVAALEKALADARAGGGERYVQRHKERGKLLPTHRYTTIPHQLKAVAPIVDGRYLRAETQQAAFAAAAGLPIGGAQPIEKERLESTAASTAPLTP